MLYDPQPTAFGVLVNQLGRWARRIVFKLVEGMKARGSGATAQRRLRMSDPANISRSLKAIFALPKAVAGSLVPRRFGQPLVARLNRQVICTNRT